MDHFISTESAASLPLFDSADGTGRALNASIFCDEVFAWMVPGFRVEEENEMRKVQENPSIPLATKLFKNELLSQLFPFLLWFKSVVLYSFPLLFFLFFSLFLLHTPGCSFFIPLYILPTIKKGVIRLVALFLPSLVRR